MSLIQYNESCETCSHIWQFSISIKGPMIVDVFLQHYIQWCTCSPDNVNVFLWNRERFFSRHVQFYSGLHVMTVNKIAWNGPEIIHHDESRSGVEEDASDSFRRFPCSSPRSGRSRIKVDVLRTWSPPESFTFPSAIGNMKFPPSHWR